MSFSHLLILGIIAVIVIPPEKLPEVARQVAKFLGDMRRMTSGVFDDLRQDVMLTPEEMLKKKNGYAPPVAPVTLEPVIPVVEKTPEEINQAEQDYLKQIQPDVVPAAEVEANPEKKSTQ